MSDDQGSLFNEPPVCPECGGRLKVWNILLGTYVPCTNPIHLPDFDGATYERPRDHIRLGKQAKRVWGVLLDGEWHTLHEIAKTTGDPEASISARIRDLRKVKFGGHVVERDFVSNGLWRYRLVRHD